MTQLHSARAEDVSAGKVNLDAVEGPYLFVWAGWPGEKGWEALARAANYMAKFGWRVRGYSDRTILMEKQAGL